MKITCKYCGIVNKPHKCPHIKRKYKTKNKDRLDTKIYNSKSYKDEREETLDRYNNNCLWSMYIQGQYNIATRVHHIVEILEDKTIATDIDNLIPLTKDNHDLIHRLYKIHPNVKKVIQELQRTMKKDYEAGIYDLRRYRGYAEKILSPLGIQIF